MASVKRGNVPPTHPTVWIGLALASVGLIVAIFSYTGTRVYEVMYAIVALVGAILALLGIMIAAFGRSFMAARASRSRRAAFSSDAMTMAKPQREAAAEAKAEVTSEDVPTVAASREKKRFAFSLGKKDKKERSPDAIPAGVFAFRRREPAREPEPAPMPEPVVAPAPSLEPEAPLITLAPAEPVRVTLRCPQCSTTFSAEGVRPFHAQCTSCGFSATV